MNAWRLAQHCLSPRLPRHDVVQAAIRTSGIQAQVMSAAELALWARADGLRPEDVQAALWRDHTLIKTWAMRGTLHLLAASELPLFVAARRAVEGRNWLKYFTYFGFTPAQVDPFLAAVPQLLGSEPMTRAELANAVARHLNAPELGAILLSSSWGSLWKPSAWRGDLCFGPNQGQNVTFVRTSAWLGPWQEMEPFPALLEVARRYLRTYGPSKPEEFAVWWEMGIVPARKLFQSLRDELAAVEVEGWPALALRETLEPMQELRPANVVNLLPYFDMYTMGLPRGRALDPLLPKEYLRRVYRPQGWLSAVVLVDGYIKGLWEPDNRRGQTTVRVRLFSELTAAGRDGIAAEAERLGDFLNTKVAVGYEPT